MKKMFAKIAAFALVLSPVTLLSVAAEEDALNAKTKIEVEIEKSGSAVDPTDPTDPTDPIDPNKPGVVDPDGDGASKPNENFGDAELGIWRIPSAMKFKGKFSVTNDMKLKLVDEESTPERILSIADVRSESDSSWALKAKLSDLNLKEGTHTITEGHSLTMKTEAKRHKVVTTDQGDQVYAKEFEDVTADDVIMDETITINNQEAVVAKALNGNGKGYIGLKFNDIVMTLEKGSNIGHYDGAIEWTLSNTAQ